MSECHYDVVGIKFQHGATPVDLVKWLYQVTGANGLNGMGELTVQVDGRDQITEAYLTEFVVHDEDD